MARLRAPQRRDQLIRTAAGVFARYGYDGATTAAIAAAAGITEPVLYRHFESKQAMFAAIVQELLLRLRERWATTSHTSSDPVEQLRVAAQQYAKAVADMPDYYAVLVSAILNCQDGEVTALIREYYHQSEIQMSEVLRRGQELGVFRNDISPADMAWIMIDLGIGYAVQETRLLPGRTQPSFFTESVLGALRAS